MTELKSKILNLKPGAGKATSEEMLVDCLTVKEQRAMLSLTSSEATNYSTPRALGGGGLLREFTPFMPAKGKIYD